MYQAQIQDNEPQLTPNQVAVIHFLDALQKYYPQEYHWFWDGTPFNKLGIVEGVINSRLPLTWLNQAKQASMLLKGDQ